MLCLSPSIETTISGMYDCFFNLFLLSFSLVIFSLLDSQISQKGTQGLRRVVVCDKKFQISELSFFIMVESIHATHFISFFPQYFFVCLTT